MQDADTAHRDCDPFYALLSTVPGVASAKQ
jgi:hypothetical protein